MINEIGLSVLNNDAKVLTKIILIKNYHLFTSCIIFPQKNFIITVYSITDKCSFTKRMYSKKVTYLMYGVIFLIK